MISILSTLTIHAQQALSEVTFTISGNKNLQLAVDGVSYDLVNSSSFGNKTTVNISNLSAGQHRFRVSRTDPNTNRAAVTEGVFILRSRYDMLVNITINGSIELIETRNAGTAEDQAPMSTSKFNVLMRNARNQPGASAKRTYVSNAISNVNNYFSVNQAGQLLQLITAESDRLQLMKSVYPKTTDPGNFYELYSLLRSPAARNEIENFVYNYSEAGGGKTAMPDAEFNTLYQDIRNKWPVSVQMNALRNTFQNTQYYFTSYQASQLIQLVSSESNRLELAKLSYRSITDRDNFGLVYNLLSFQSSKDELTAYINNYRDEETGQAMPEAEFNSLYDQIRNQWPVSAQMNSLRNAFNNTNHYFTSYQASRLIELVSSESNRLELAKLSYRSITDRNNFGLVFDLLRFQSSKDELTAYINNYGGGTAHSPMPDAEFTTLYNQISNQWPASAKMNSLRNAFNNTNNYFTSYQASRLIQLVTGESNRLELAKLSYRSITDRQNFGLVFDLLSYQSSRDELTAYINNYGGGGGTGNRVPMPDSEFNTLYQNIQLQFLPGAKMSALTNTFNNPNYYFSSAQAKQLILLVSLESNRLQLCKLSYRTITDRANFTQVYEVLNSQASRDELDAYVKAYQD